MIQTDAEIDFMLQDAGENTQATYGTASVYGIFRRNVPLEYPSANGSVSTVVSSMLIRAGTLGDLATDEELTINGPLVANETFLIRDVQPDSRSSEKLSRIILAPVPG